MGDFLDPTDNNFGMKESIFLSAQRLVDSEDLSISETDVSNRPKIAIIETLLDKMNNEQKEENMRLMIVEEPDDEDWDTDTDGSERDDEEEEEEEDDEEVELDPIAIREIIESTVMTITEKNKEKSEYLKTLEAVLTLGRWSISDELLQLWLDIRAVLVQPVKLENIKNGQQLSAVHILSSATRSAAKLWKFLVFHQTEDYPVHLLNELNEQNVVKKTLRFLSVLEAYPKCIKLLGELKKDEPDFYEVHEIQHNKYVESP